MKLGFSPLFIKLLFGFYFTTVNVISWDSDCFNQLSQIVSIPVSPHFKALSLLGLPLSSISGQEAPISHFITRTEIVTRFWVQWESIYFLAHADNFAHLPVFPWSHLKRSSVHCVSLSMSCRIILRVWRRQDLIDQQ